MELDGVREFKYGDNPLSTLLLMKEEIAIEVERPVVKKLLELMEFRNSHPAFDVEGDIAVELPEEGLLEIRRSSGADYAVLKADLVKKTFTIEHS